MKIFTNWTNLKQLIIDKNLDMFYTVCSYKYNIYALYNYNQFYTEIWKSEHCAGIDMIENDVYKSDFETNYQQNARKM